MSGGRRSIALAVIVTFGIFIVGYFMLCEMLAALAPTNWFAAMLAPAFADPSIFSPAAIIIGIGGAVAILRGR